MKRRMVILVSVALWAMGSVGCGSKSTTTAIMPPEDSVPPAAVTGLAFQLNATQNPNIVVTWNPGAELDLAGYNVYRARVPNLGDIPAKREPDHVMAGIQLVTMVANSLFMDEDVVAGASYMYAISAIDVSGNESPRVLSTPVRVDVATRDNDEGLQLN